MKRLLIISIACALSMLTLVETIGMYVTENICAPCGDSSIEVEFVVESNVDDQCSHHHHANSHNECTAQDEKCCTDHEECCTDHEQDHQHEKKYHFVKNGPTFFSKASIPTFNVTLLCINLPSTHLSEFVGNPKEKITHEKVPPEVIQTKIHLSYLCTYLI